MRATTVRFSDTAHELIEDGARLQGVSFAQYVREAALARWALEAGLRAATGQRAEDRDRVAALQAGIAELRRLGVTSAEDGG